MSETATEVSLRPFEPGDAAAVHRWFNNPRGDQDPDGAAGELLAGGGARTGSQRAMDDSGEDRKYAIVVEGHEEPVGFTALYGLSRQTAPELGALIGDDVRRQAGRPPRRGADDRQGLRRVRRPPRLRPHPRLQRGGEADRRRPRLAARGDDARRTCAATASLPTARSGACCPDEFRAAAADLLE